MNAVMYVPTATGGHARYAFELLGALRESAGRHDVALVTSRNLAPEFRGAGYRVHDVLPALRTSGFASKVEWAYDRVTHYYRREKTFLRWMLENRDVELVHFQEYCPLFAARHFARLSRAGRRLFFTVHNIRDHHRRGAAVDRSLERLWRSAWNRCHGLFVHSEGLKVQLAEFLGPSHPPIHVVRHGVWTTAAVAERKPESIGHRTLLCFGVVRRNKGVHVLLDALSGLPEYRAVVAGQAQDAAYAAEIGRQATSLADGQCTFENRFIGQEEMNGLFGRSSAVVLPYTDFAAQSGVLHDAVAFGVPVVATAVGALGETVTEMGIGEVAPPNDAAALRAAIDRLHTPERYARALASIRRVRDEHSWKAAARHTLDAYTSCF
jgi:glycosyltransferase involved in cell wall biosynthesis